MRELLILVLACVQFVTNSLTSSCVLLNASMFFLQPTLLAPRHPAHLSCLSSSTVLLHMVFDFPVFLFLSGYHVSVFLQWFSLSCFKMWPVHLYCLNFNSSNLLVVLVLFEISLIDIFCGHLNFNFHLKHLKWKTFNLFASLFFHFSMFC